MHEYIVGQSYGIVLFGIVLYGIDRLVILVIVVPVIFNI